MRPTSRRLAGIAGPVAFIATWAVLGARQAGYSPVDDPISRLAAVDAATRVPMTIGFLAFAAGVACFATELGRIGPALRWAALASAVGAVGIAATPLDSSLGGGPHGAAAACTYTALAALPALAARPLAAGGHRWAALASLAVGTATAGALLASATVSDGRGLWQRIGLTVADAWIIAASVTGPPTAKAGR